MENLLNTESVKRVVRVLKNFDPALKVEALNTSDRTAIDADLSLKCEVGAIVKSLLFKADDSFIICLISGDKKCSLNKLKFFLPNLYIVKNIYYLFSIFFWGTLQLKHIVNLGLSYLSE